MMRSVGAVVAAVACASLTSCSDSTGTSSGGDCESHYDVVATAPTWSGLQRAMRRTTTWGRVASVRTQVRGDDVGAGDEDAVRIVDLLGPQGQRRVQVDVWRTDSGGWRAGAWSQCID